jgi:hypothetical protein
MKKTLAALSIVAIALAATPALAKGPNLDHGLKLGVWGKLGGRIQNKFVDDSKFLLTGSVVSTATNSLTVSVKSSINASNIVNNQSTVVTNASTKIIKAKKTVIALSDLKAGDQVVVTGTVSGSTLTAVNIHVVMPHGSKAMGSITAKTNNSVTIKNNSTGVVQTFTTDGDTKVNINGESKTMADIQVGDKGFVKFRSSVSGFVAKVISLFR